VILILANYLKKRNIGKGNVILIISERSHYYIISTLTVMKSGAAILPIDPKFPKECVRYMIDETKSKFILKYITNEEINNNLRFDDIMEYELQSHPYEMNTDPVENTNVSSDLCYIIFTSSTTSKPKGTLICHNNLVNYSLFSQTNKGKSDMYGDDFDNVLPSSKFTFDMSIGEIFYPLLKGCKIILCNNNEFNNSVLIGLLIMKHKIEYIFTVPSRIENYMNNEKFVKSLKLLKWTLIGGERWNSKTLKNIVESSNTEIINPYGPIETIVICTMKQLTDRINNKDNKNITITIGKPLCNCEIYILDKNYKAVPIGVEGEINVGGKGVGKGYLNRPELISEKFIDTPFYDFNNNLHNGKLYRTEDLGK